MDNRAEAIIRADAALICGALEGFAQYDFAQDLRERLGRAGISANTLADRAGVSHTAVGKWLSGEGRPNGKERMKTLGMALGMDTEQLDDYLRKNSYSGLYAKSPLDNACVLIIRTYGAREDIVRLYRELVGLCRLKSSGALSGGDASPTEELRRSFDRVTDAEGFAQWIEKHDGEFSAAGKTLLANPALTARIRLYVGGCSINDLFVAGQLPVALRNLLYPLLGRREIGCKGLRDKLIAFGLYENMTEEELDALLSPARLRSVSQPVSRPEQALLAALRLAHERYPYYSLFNAERAIKQLREERLFSAGRRPDPAAAELLAEFQARLEDARFCAGYYDRHRGGEEEAFELAYTDRSDRGLANYIRDVIEAAAAEGALSREEAQALPWLPRGGDGCNF